jgi:hypothetical protein
MNEELQTALDGLDGSELMEMVIVHFEHSEHIKACFTAEDGYQAAFRRLLMEGTEEELSARLEYAIELREARDQVFDPAQGFSVVVGMPVLPAPEDAHPSPVEDSCGNQDSTS